MEHKRVASTGGFLLVLGALGGSGCGDDPAPPAPEAEESVPAGAASAPPPPESPGEPTYERVVLVTIDTLRADHLGCYGYFRQTSPFLDELAARSVVFTRAYSSSSQTAPSHASIFTGLPPEAHGVAGNLEKLPASLSTMASLLGGHGFETAAVTSVEFLASVANGFDYRKIQRCFAELAGAAAIRWLENKRTEPRFFLWLHLYEPHRWKSFERRWTKSLAALRERSAAGEPEAYAYLALLHGLPTPPEDQPFAPVVWRMSERPERSMESGSVQELLGHYDNYDAAIGYADAELERVYRAVESLGLPGGTLWVITSDHGEGLGNHAYTGHSARIWEEQLRVPLIIHGSDGRLAPSRVAELVRHVDLLPTIAQLTGAPLEGAGALPGVSLVPLLCGRGEGWPAQAAFAQNGIEEAAVKAEESSRRRLFSLVSGRFKYILDSFGEDECYDLERDPGERENLAGLPSPERDALKRELEFLLERYRARAPESVESQEVSPEILDELRDLGYVR